MREDGRGSTRRGLIRGAVLAAGPGAMAAWTATSLADRQAGGGDEGWLTGHIRALDPPEVVDILPMGETTPLRLRVTAASELNRDGPARLEDFLPGDLVAFRPGPRAATGEATVEMLQAGYHRLDDVRVLARSGGRFDTASGPVVVDAQSEVPDLYGPGGVRVPSKALHEIAAGDSISVIGRHDPEQGAFAARFVRAESE